MRKYALIALSLLMGLAALLFPLPPQQKAVLFIMLFTGALWFTEALPLHVTALLVPLLLYMLAGTSPADAFNPFFDPVVVLLLGGFVLAVGMQKHGLDGKIAYFFINRFGHTPGRFLLGIMAVTAFLSLWMTNTASAALMIPIVLVVLKSNGLEPLKSKYGKAVVLGVAYAATVGGMGTLIGSTPNAIAMKFLADEGIKLTFLGWMEYGLPLVLILLPIAWALLMLAYPPSKRRLKIRKQKARLTQHQKEVFAIFLATVLLWLTTGIHHITASMVSVVPIILLYIFGLLDTKDFTKAHWPTLILFGGGLSLGSAIMAVGLDRTLASALVSLISGQPLLIILLTVAAFSILMTIFASNTAAAAVVVPVIIPMAAELGISVKLLTIVAALGVSLDFVVPVGTPPSAIAYSTGYIHVRDMVKAGMILAVVSTLALALLARYFWL